MKDRQKAPKSAPAAGKTAPKFTDEERGAMRERAQELKAAARPAGRGVNADVEGTVLAKIAEMPEGDRVMAEQLHALIKASAPNISPRLWYGMPAYSKDGRSSAFFKAGKSSRRAMRRWASATWRTSTKAKCGRPLSP